MPSQEASVSASELATKPENMTSKHFLVISWSGMKESEKTIRGYRAEVRTATRTSGRMAH